MMYKTIARLAAIGTSSLLVIGVTSLAWAAPREAATSVARISFGALERKAMEMGIRPTELKIGSRIAEIEGYDRDGREAEIKLDARDGRVLKRKFED